MPRGSFIFEFEVRSLLSGFMSVYLRWDGGRCLFSVPLQGITFPKTRISLENKDLGPCYTYVYYIHFMDFSKITYFLCNKKYCSNKTESATIGQVRAHVSIDIVLNGARKVFQYRTVSTVCKQIACRRREVAMELELLTG